ncbi:hypothetical protein [Cysteiniphilum halobium]|uniref:hypothetical protein n=1 Tax=Cysteiniphilum halobium TaxID=2219059 RepID=UPI000E65B3A1|nr:hypothetical protein [Cysteiniphilum halobium]
MVNEYRNLILVVVLFFILPFISFGNNFYGDEYHHWWGDMLVSVTHPKWGNKFSTVKEYQFKFDSSKQYLIEIYKKGYRSDRYKVLDNENGAIAFVLQGDIKEKFYKDKDAHKPWKVFEYVKGDYFIVGNHRNLYRVDEVVGDINVELAVMRFK